MKIPSLFVFAFVALFTGCTGAVASGVSDAQIEELPGASTTEEGQASRSIQTVDISLYLVVSDTDPSLSTRRSEDELREILSGINDIWSQADIFFDLRNVSTVNVRPDVLRRTIGGDLGAFFEGLRGDIQITEPSTINAFYLREVGGPNGINPFGSRTFFVIDEPSVHDRRVTSHEIGHILGLHHDLEDAGALMFSGTNGMEISEDEATVARYVADGILRGIR